MGPLLSLARAVSSLRFWLRAKDDSIGPGTAVLVIVGLVAALVAQFASPQGSASRPAAQAVAKPAAKLEAPSPPTIKEDDRTWRVESYDRAVVVTQTALSEGRCLLEARRGDELLWKSSLCAGKKLDFKFVSPSGDRMAVLHPLPKIEESVGATPVMQILERGQQKIASAAGATVADRKRLRTAGTSFYWLAGSLDAPGEAPHYSDSGAAFEFATVDGRHYHLALDPR